MTCLSLYTTAFDLFVLLVVPIPVILSHVFLYIDVSLYCTLFWWK